MKKKMYDVDDDGAVAAAPHKTIATMNKILKNQ